MSVSWATDGVPADAPISMISATPCRFPLKSCTWKETRVSSFSDTCVASVTLGFGTFTSGTHNASTAPCSPGRLHPPRASEYSKSVSDSPVVNCVTKFTPRHDRGTLRQPASTLQHPPLQLHGNASRRLHRHGFSKRDNRPTMKAHCCRMLPLSTLAFVLYKIL